MSQELLDGILLTIANVLKDVIGKILLRLFGLPLFDLGFGDPVHAGHHSGMLRMALDEPVEHLGDVIPSVQLLVLGIGLEK